MTEKQENILQAALTLFAENGYDATSTSKVAKLAGVSEGLIFRHFENKEGLLSAIMQMGKEKAATMYNEILLQDDPKKILKDIISLPFSASEEDYHFWKLLYAVKWQANMYDDSMSAPLRSVLMQVFKSLKYKKPEAETEAVMILIDGIATAVLLRKPDKQQDILRVLLEKYDL